MSSNATVERTTEEDLQNDDFSIAGSTIGSIMRQLLSGFSLPIKDATDHLDKIGKDKLIYVKHKRYGNMIFSAADILEVLPESVKFYPVEDITKTIEKFMMFHKVAIKKGLPSFQRRIRNKNLIDIITKVPSHETKVATLKPFKIRIATNPIMLIKEKITELNLKQLPIPGLDNDGQMKFKHVMDNYLVEIFKQWHDIFLAGATERAIIDAQDAENAAIQADAAANATEQAKIKAVDDSPITSSNGVAMAEQQCQIAESAAIRAASAAASARSNAIVAGTPQAEQAAHNAEGAANKAEASAQRARAARDRAQVLASITIAVITVHVLDGDSCSGHDDVSGASVSIRNMTYPEVKSKSRTANNDGKAILTGRFGPSLEGPSEIAISADIDGDYEINVTKGVNGTTKNVRIILVGYDA